MLSKIAPHYNGVYGNGNIRVATPTDRSHAIGSKSVSTEF